MTTDQTAERQLLRDVLTWARANGWRRQPQIRTETAWSRDPEGDGGVRPHTVSFTRTFGPIRLIIWGFGQIDVSGPQQAADVLVAVGILPAEFSSAYQAGVRAERMRPPVQVHISPKPEVRIIPVPVIDPRRRA